MDATNQTLSNPLTWDEFLRFSMACLFLFGTIQGVPRQMFWANDSPDIYYGAPFCLHSHMSRNRFEAILKKFKLTTMPAPTFKHPFHPVNDLIGAFNKHTAACFSPGWVACLDKSMSVWTNQWTCPGWMFVPRKPHPMGNEYHSICCGLSGIMFAIELVQGKDEPSQIPNEKYSEHGKTAGLLMRLTESIHHSGRVVIMDSGFCALQSLIQLASVGVYGSAVIKERRYFPEYINGDAIDPHFESKGIGETDILPGTLDGINFKIFCMKEEDYVMKLMATYGALRPMEGGETNQSLTSRNGTRENPTGIQETTGKRVDGVLIDSYFTNQKEVKAEYGASVNQMWCGNGALVRWKLDGNGMALCTLHVNKQNTRSTFARQLAGKSASEPSIVGAA
ncbi:xylulose kinase [Fragilaria crotonensis]|nr:xylulose kinase [Fragilaria crotonensis]